MVASRVSVLGSSQQCWASLHCRFMAHAGSVDLDNTIGLLITGSVLQDNTVGSLLTDSDGPFAFYCFIINFNLYFSWNWVLLYICYVDDRSINIKHYKCYSYSSNVLIQILIPQNKKEMFSDFTDCAMLLGLLTIIWRATLGHTGPCTSWIVQWKIVHLFPIPRLRWILLAPIVVRRSPYLTAFRCYISCAVVQKRWYPKRN